MKINYKTRSFVSVLSILTLFMVLLFVLFFSREERLRDEVMSANESAYLTIITNYLDETTPPKDSLDNLNDLLPLFPDDFHLTILDRNTDQILFDNILPKFDWDNFSQKEKVELNRIHIYNESYTVRDFDLKEMKYSYYGIIKDDLIVRVGIPFVSKALQNKTSSSFLFVVILLAFFLVVEVYVYYFVKYREDLRKLKQYVSSFNSEVPKMMYHVYKDDEIKALQTKISTVYNELEKKEKAAELEREKLIQHFNNAEEGISFFTENREQIYTNVHFIQYLNILLDKTTMDVSSVFSEPIFIDVVRFLENPGKEKAYKNKLYGNNRVFAVNAILFEDKSFEIIIRKITEAEKNEMDAAMMTNNIAHELRTPVTSMCGYLETLLNVENITPEKQNYFLERAYKQCIRLTEIMQDIILLSKTTYAPQFFLIEPVNVLEVVNELLAEELVQKQLSDCNMKVDIKISQAVIIKGNRTLIASIFRNLGSNAIKYAGEGSRIIIHNYMEDDNFYYFSFADTGTGLDEKHLEKLFERFYRITDGRTRDQGGSGLGLSIVRDSVTFHKGEIFVKNRAEGGLEYLFTLKKI